MFVGPLNAVVNHRDNQRQRFGAGVTFIGLSDGLFQPEFDSGQLLADPIV